MDPDELLEIQQEQERQRLETLNNQATVSEQQGQELLDPEGLREIEAGDAQQLLDPLNHEGAK